MLCLSSTYDDADEIVEIDQLLQCSECANLFESLEVFTQHTCCSEEVPVQEDETLSNVTSSKSNWKRNRDKIARYQPKSLPEYPKCNHLSGAFRCNTLSMQEVNNFHSLFYKYPDRAYQSNFILRFIEVLGIKRRRSRQKNKVSARPRHHSSKYYVQSDNGMVPVCLQSFTSILGITRARVNKVANDFARFGKPVDKRGGFRNTEKYSKQKSSVMNFIKKLKVKSNYRRGKCSGKLNLPSGLNVKKLWRIYSSITGNVPVKTSYFRQILNTAKINIGSGLSTCLTCFSLREQIKAEKEDKRKVQLFTEKRVHKFQYKAFYAKLRDQDKDTLILSFEYRKVLALQKIPDQLTSRDQFYFQNLTIVQGHGKTPLNPSTVKWYCWNENEYPNDPNLVSSCVLDSLCYTDMSSYKRVRLVSDFCGDQKENSALIAMCHVWLGRFALSNIEEVELIFPIAGHNVLPTNRVFDNVESRIQEKGEITKREEVVEILSEISTVKMLGADCLVGDFCAVARRCLTDPKNWTFQISTCKRVIFTKTKDVSSIYTRGEKAYRCDFGEKQILTKPGVNMTEVNPNVIEIENSEN